MERFNRVSAYGASQSSDGMGSAPFRSLLVQPVTERVHFSPCRTSRPAGPVGFRFPVETFSWVRALAEGPGIARSTSGGKLRRWAALSSRPERCQARTVHVVFRTWCRYRPRSAVGHVSLGQTPLTPVSDAIALGNFRTRLETRTKESSMYASHWVYVKP